MATTIPVGWRGFPQQHIVPGGFHLFFTVAAATDEWTKIDVTGIDFIARSDVQAKLAQAGYTFTDLAARGLLKAARLQNLDPSNAGEFSEFASLVDGTAGAPAPADAYVTMQADGGFVDAEYTTGEAAHEFWYRAATGLTLTLLNVEVWFDVIPAEV